MLADFRDAMLMALLCSVALRDVRNELVAFWRSWLSADRCAVAEKKGRLWGGRVCKACRIGQSYLVVE